MMNVVTLSNPIKEALKEMKAELVARVGKGEKDITTQNGCSCYGCEGCGYNCSGSSSAGWFLPRLRGRTLEA